MSQLRSDYQVYLQELEHQNQIYLYDEDGHVVSIQSKSKYTPLNYVDWLDSEMRDAIEEEDYRYAAKVRDEIIYIKLYTAEEFERYIA